MQQREPFSLEDGWPPVTLAAVSGAKDPRQDLGPPVHSWGMWSGTNLIKTLDKCLGPLDWVQGNHAWGMEVLVWDQAFKDPRYV
jgi:hypothetical protein